MTTAKAEPRTTCDPETNRRSPPPTGDFADIDGFARVVTIDELADNDFNCNIRRYADNSPPPELQDVRAHLHGGVPTAEIEGAKDLMDRAGLSALEVLFADRGDGYADWCHNVGSVEGREAAHGAIGYAVIPTCSRKPVAPMVGRHRTTHAALAARPTQPRRLAPATRRELGGVHGSGWHGSL